MMMMSMMMTMTMTNYDDDDDVDDDDEAWGEIVYDRDRVDAEEDQRAAMGRHNGIVDSQSVPLNTTKNESEPLERVAGVNSHVARQTHQNNQHQRKYLF